MYLFIYFLFVLFIFITNNCVDVFFTNEFEWTIKFFVINEQEGIFKGHLNYVFIFDS